MDVHLRPSPGPGRSRIARLHPGPRPWQRFLFVIIFGNHTRAGQAFDAVLLAVIAASMVAVMLESVESIRSAFGGGLYALEWFFTIAFAIEYVLRLSCCRPKRKYVLSFFGIVDLLAILPTFISLVVPGAQSLVTVRALRLLRVFRVFKLVRFMGEAEALREVIWVSRAKIIVFLLVVTVVVTIVGALMHLIEGRRPGSDFASIPQSIYWAIVTMATVGYGDIVAETPLGKFLSAVLIVFGYALIVVPTGIVTAEWQTRTGLAPHAPATVKAHSNEGDRYCSHCGQRLPRRPTTPPVPE